MYDYNCGRCGGLVAEPMKPYGYAGNFCHCAEPKRLTGSIVITTTSTSLTTPSEARGIDELVYDLLEEHIHTEPDGENLKYEFSPLRHEIHEDIVNLLHQELQKTRAATARKIYDELIPQPCNCSAIVNKIYQSELDQPTV